MVEVWLGATAAAAMELQLRFNSAANTGGTSTAPAAVPADPTDAATGTQKAIRLLRASDSAQSDILILQSGNLDLATATTFCNATSCSVAKWYDQSGNAADAAQATAASQPAWAFSGGPGTRAFCVVWGGAALFLTATIPVVGTTISGSFVTIRTNAGALSRNVFSDSSGNVYLQQGASANQVQAAESTSFVIASASDLAWHNIQTIMNGASSGIVVDGTLASGTTTARSNGTTLTIGVNGSGVVGSVNEAGMWPVALSAPQYAALESNQKTYWGTP